MIRLSVLLAGVLLLAGCTKEPGSTVITKGKLTVACDEAVEPLMRAEVEEFQRQYTEATVTLRVVHAREAIADFVNDSVRVIVSGRPLNKEERDALAASKVAFQEFKIALSAVAVIVHRENPQKQLRLTEADSMFSGHLVRWHGPRKGVIDVVLSDVNSSTNEIVRTTVMRGRAFAASATPFSSSRKVIEYVRDTRNAIGIVPLNWLKGFEQSVSILSVGGPGWQPDSTVVPGQFFSPAQAWVYKGYYPITTAVYMYTREVSRDLGVGLITFVASVPGQKVVQNAGLVPATMPVRLVQLTSEKIQ